MCIVLTLMFWPTQNPKWLPFWVLFDFLCQKRRCQVLRLVAINPTLLFIFYLLFFIFYLFFGFVRIYSSPTCNSTLVTIPPLPSFPTHHPRNLIFSFFAVSPVSVTHPTPSPIFSLSYCALSLPFIHPLTHRIPSLFAPSPPLRHAPHIFFPPLSFSPHRLPFFSSTQSLLHLVSTPLV